ncbi:MAG: acyl-ACP--UDP-N-acetylglucosamine O-acyltransferase [Muribaculaceae bacterium]|nr:acyl-ACP--UDP-N-acetylglucosamine O-acyltransferase [Muribaculaceae bacterium]
MAIHKLTSINPAAVIGADVEIGPFTTIDANVEIGDGCKIGSNVTILSGARIGNGVTIFPGAVVSAIPQDLKFRGEETTAVIGDNTVLRECVTVNRGTAAKGTTIVGSNCLIMAYSHVAHDCKVGNNVIISNASQLAGEVEVDDFAIIGGGSLIHQFCHIGSYIMLQGGALVNKDIPPFIRAAREPISYTGINTIGLRRRGFSSEAVDVIKETYRILYFGGYPTVADVLEVIRQQVPATPERDAIIDFVAHSERGILRGYAGADN